MNNAVNALIEKSSRWQVELSALRTIILSCGLTEEVKWKQPCYTFQNNNVVLIHGFKEFCGIMFFKGVLMNDVEDILVQQTETVQATRQIKFTNMDQIEKLEKIIKAYIFEAIEIEKAGLKIDYKKAENFDIPEELTQKLASDLAFNTAFEALTTGRKKGYYLHFAGAKQSATRISRIEKSSKRILNSFGLNDCVCGLSKRKPSCDGSHKSIPNWKPY